MKALVTCLHLQRRIEEYRSAFENCGVALILPEITGQQLSAGEMRALFAAGVDVAILGDDAVDREALVAGKAAGLKAIVKWGIGTDAIDKAAARALGVPVYNTPGAFGEEVADLAMAYLLMLARPLHKMDAGVREGAWLQIQGRSLSGLTAGVIGLGSIGQAILRRARGFGMTTLGYDVSEPAAEDLAALATEFAPLSAVFERADILFLACALTPENRHLVNADRLALMKPDAFLINVARGPLVDEAALVEALKQGRLGGAGLDVFEIEPLPETSALRALDTVVLGSHCGSNTREAVARINALTVEMALRLLGVAGAERPNRLERMNRVA
ncbi:MAG: phosphoglycerate dehydrogenase [Pseudomonadota bacterium]